MLRKKQKKGQSTLEYIILVTAVIVIIIGLVVSNNSPFRQSLNATFNAGIDNMKLMSDKAASSLNL